MTMSTIAVQRLQNQQLVHSKLRKPGEVVARLVVVQAQDYAGGKWSIGLRLPDSNDLRIEQAIADKTIVRTWALRGTLHFVAAADVRWLLALVAARNIARNARAYRNLELDERTLARSNAVLAKALGAGKQLNRTELLARLEQSGISTKGLRAVYMLQRASLDALICQTVMYRNNPTYMSLDQLQPTAKRVERDDAVAELAKRYFITRTPATLQDFIWWSGLSPVDARGGLEAIQSRLIQETIAGRTYWLSHSVATAPTPDRLPTAYLLPGYDEYLLSYKDRTASLDLRHAKKLGAGNGFLSPIVINGQVVGTWRRTFKKGAVVIEANLFAPLSATARRALVAAAGRYGQFLGM